MSHYLDSRDLEDELTAYEGAGVGQDIDDIRDRRAIRELRDEVGDEWRYGVVLIPEGSFVDYARELADDIGAIDRDAGWPTAHIDWEAAADDLKIDYIETDFRGATYLYRA